MSKNIFYHFTANFFLKSIKQRGLVLGSLPVSLKRKEVISGYQWITKNPSFDQKWAIGSGKLPYKRNEFRLTIRIPDRHLEKAMQFINCRDMCPEIFDDMTRYGDPENWYIYEGIIPSSWIHKIQKNEGN